MRFRCAMMTFAVAICLAGCAHPPRLGDKTGQYRCVLFSPDGKRVASIRSFTDCVVFETASGASVGEFRPDKKVKASTMFALACGPDGNLLAATRGKKEICVWDTHTGAMVSRLDVPTNIKDCRLSSDGRWAVVIERDKSPAIWDIAKARSVQLSGSVPIKWFFGFSPDGGRVAAYAADNRIKIWDVATGALISEVPDQKKTPFFVTFSPNSNQLAVCAGDVSLFALDTHQSSLTVEPPTLTPGARAAGAFWLLLSTMGGRPSGSMEVFGAAPAGPVAFSPEGTHLAMIGSVANMDIALGGEEKQQVRVFDLSNTQLVSTVAYNQKVGSVAFSPDGGLIGTAGLGVDVWHWQKLPATPQAGQAPGPFATVVVHLRTNFIPSDAVPPGFRQIHLAAFDDARPEERWLGTRTAAFKVKMSEIVAARSVADTLREALSTLFPASKPEAQMEVSGRLTKFLVATPANAVAWKVQATVEVELRVANKDGTVLHSSSYTGHGEHTTAVWPGQTIIERSCDDAVNQLLHNIVADPIWLRHEVGVTGASPPP